MKLDEEQTEQALRHVENTTAVIESILPLLRNARELQPEMVSTIEHVSSKARAWLNQQRVRESMDKLRAGAEPDSQPEAQKKGPAPEAPPIQPDSAPQINPLDAMGDLLKTLSPLADILGRLGSMSRR